MQDINQWLDPKYVQISRKEAARILGRSPTEFDRLRKMDPDCPTGFKTGTERGARVLFRLSEIYRYSEILIERAQA
ncbi:hypothetical protein FZZ93_01255 [Halomonas eurihalina]|uniref:Uncharacterized protein n=1 Tax=Halomonas eurihalina TaxID=42566 RepID=A0A5D9DEW8_HALER|nr:hypothetical protein [Halomonas eurihalina]MDR5858177.1 hypothetical protein [Halomonas eurihalina]TZG41321.1 hypothetical protein FZZ93_01255 [Halomonas eurihalina]